MLASNVFPLVPPVRVYHAMKDHLGYVCGRCLIFEIYQARLVLGSVGPLSGVDSLLFNLVLCAGKLCAGCAAMTSADLMSEVKRLGVWS